VAADSRRQVDGRHSPEPSPAKEEGQVGGETGRQALHAFARAFGETSPRVAMRAACARLRQRVAEAGWQPGLDAYLRAFGLRVLEAPIPTAGRLDYDDGQYVIRVQRAESVDARRPPMPLRVGDASNRQRFSIAHEIGHALILERLGEHPDALPGLDDPSIWPELERLCDQSAADLLVPLDDFLRAVVQLGCSPWAVERLAEGFRVSVEVILLRFLSAGARSISLWQLRAPASGDDAVVAASVVRGYRAGRAPLLDPGAPSSVLSPDLVHQVACGGRVRCGRVQIAMESSPWNGAAVADGGRPRVSPFEPVQLRWLDDESGGDATLPVSLVRGGLDAQVTLLLFPASAAADGDPLWTALASG
jgi:hypothetical protein